MKKIKLLCLIASLIVSSAFAKEFDWVFLGKDDKTGIELFIEEFPVVEMCIRQQDDPYYISDCISTLLYVKYPNRRTEPSTAWRKGYAYTSMLLKRKYDCIRYKYVTEGVSYYRESKITYDSQTPVYSTIPDLKPPSDRGPIVLNEHIQKLCKSAYPGGAKKYYFNDINAYVDKSEDCEIVRRGWTGEVEDYKRITKKTKDALFRTLDEKRDCFQKKPWKVISPD